MELVIPWAGKDTERKMETFKYSKEASCMNESRQAGMIKENLIDYVKLMKSNTNFWTFSRKLIKKDRFYWRRKQQKLH